MPGPAGLHARHIDAAKRRLVNLARLSDKTVRAERAILSAANDRLAAVRTDLDKLRPRVNVDEDAAQRYLDLTKEVGILETVIAQARQVLGA